MFLIAYDHDLRRGRTSGDIDVMMDIRDMTRATQAATATLEGFGYQLDPPSPDGRAHRFRAAHRRSPAAASVPIRIDGLIEARAVDVAENPDTHTPP